MLEFLDYLNFKCFRASRTIPVSGPLSPWWHRRCGDFLAEQLRDRDAGLSIWISVARATRLLKRAQVRGLDNITWIQGSIPDLPEMDIGRFDYINCCGVLHHLESPVAGLMALKSVLGEKGAWVLWYTEQSAERRYTNAGTDAPDKFRRAVCANKGRQYEDPDQGPSCQQLVQNLEKLTLPITSITETQGIRYAFCTSRIAPIPFLNFRFIAQCGLEFVDFAYRSRWRYQPRTYLNNSPLMGKLEKLDAGSSTQ